MPHNHSRRHTEAKDAAQILRGYKERIERLEQQGAAGEEAVQLYRKAAETVTVTDSLSIQGGSSGAFEWNTSEWGFDEWEDN